MSIQVFISYRRDGGDFLALHMYEVLTRAGYEVFYDIESLRSGKFNTKIYSKIEECTDFILILPKDGLDRCVDPNDWVRLEIEYAIKCEKNIVPLMMRNFVWPENLPPSLKDLPNYNGITASSELFEGVVIALEKRFLKSQKRHRVPDTGPLLIDEQDENTIIEGELDNCLFEEVKTRIGNPETNPKFKGITDIDKGRLYKYLLWAERGMRWSDDPHNMLVEPFYGSNYNMACRCGYKEELESINRSIQKNIHDFVEMKVDLNNKGPYMLDNPAQCGGDFRYLWECILFQTRNLTCFEMRENYGGGHCLYVAKETDNRLETISKFMDEFRRVCPKWLYNGNEGVTHSKRAQEFVERFEKWNQLDAGGDIQRIQQSNVLTSIVYIILILVSLLLQVIVLSFGWRYFHTLPNRNSLSNVCMYVYMFGIMLWSLFCDWKLVSHVRYPIHTYKGLMRGWPFAFIVLNVVPIIGLICCLLPIQFRIMDLFDGAKKWIMFAGYVLINTMSCFFGLLPKGRKVSNRAVEIKKSISVWQRDMSNH